MHADRSRRSPKPLFRNRAPSGPDRAGPNSRPTRRAQRARRARMRRPQLAWRASSIESSWRPSPHEGDPLAVRRPRGVLAFKDEDRRLAPSRGHGPDRRPNPDRAPDERLVPSGVERNGAPVRRPGWLRTGRDYEKVVVDPSPPAALSISVMPVSQSKCPSSDPFGDHDGSDTPANISPSAGALSGCSAEPSELMM